MKTLIAVNNLVEVNQLAYANHCQLWYRLGKQYPNDQFGFCNPRRMSIDRMRNFAAKSAMDLEFDYLLFLDDDVLVPVVDTLGNSINPFGDLVKWDKDIIAGVTLIRGYPYHPMIFNFMGQQLMKDGRGHWVDNYKELASPDGLLECDAVGFSLCLIKVSLLRRLKPPYFITGDNHTEDVYFCNKAKLEAPGTRVFVNTNLHTAHILGSDIIMPANKVERIAWDEMTNPGIADRTKFHEATAPIIDPKILLKPDYASVIMEEIFGEGPKK